MATWAEGYQPYARMLRKLKLPPRGKLRSRRNYERVRLVCEAMHAVKVKQDAKKRKRR